MKYFAWRDGRDDSDFHELIYVFYFKMEEWDKSIRIVCIPFITISHFPGGRDRKQKQFVASKTMKLDLHNQYLSMQHMDFFYWLLIISE